MRLEVFRRCFTSPVRAFVLAMTMAPVLPALAYEPPPGWTMRVADNGLLQQPADLPPGRIFQLWAAPPLSVGGAQGLDAFARITDPMRGLGTSGRPACKPPEVLTAGVIVQSCVVTVAGENVETQVYMRPPRDGLVEWMRIAFSQDEALLQRYGGGLKAISTRSNELWPALRAQAGDDKRQRETTARSEQQERRAAVERAIHVAPGKGVADKDIAYVLWTWYQPSGESRVEHLHLLLKDGTGYLRLDTPPDELDMAAVRRLQPERVMQWRREGKDWQIKESDESKWRTILGNPAQPASAGEKVEGKFTHSWYSILGGSSAQNHFQFRGDGQFEQSGRAMFGTGGMAAAAGVTGMATTSYSRDGSTGTSSVSAVGAGAGGGSTQRRNGADFTGRYRLERWAMVVERDNGEQQRVLFAFNGDKQRAVFIKDSGYSR